MTGNGLSNGIRLPQRIPWALISLIVAAMAQIIALVIWAKNEHDSRIQLEHRFENYVTSIDKQRAALIETVNQKNRDQDEIVNRSANEVRALTQRIDRSEFPITKRLDDVETLSRSLNDKQNVVNTQVDARLQAIDAHTNRIDDRLDRVVQALDKTYSLLNEHMRSHP